MENRDFYIEFYDIVDQIIKEYLDIYSLPSYVGTKLFEGSYSIKCKYNELRMNGISASEVKRMVVDTIIPEYSIDRETIMPGITLSFPAIANTLGNRFAIYIYNTRQLKYLVPLINIVNRPLLLLCEQSVDLDIELPEYVEGIDLDYSIAEHVVTNDNSISNRLAKTFVVLNSIITEFNIEGVVLLEGCHYQEQMIGEICNRHGIPSILLQQGWPSLMHTMFRRFPYSHFLTWGNSFNELWQKFNPRPNYFTVGYPYPVKTKKGETITFFLQAPLFISDETYFDKLIEMAEKTAEKYPAHTVLVREHPEFRLSQSQKTRLSSHSNIVIVSDWALSEVFATTAVLVSHFSSSLIEGIAHGCIPIAFDITTDSEYSPNLEKAGIGHLSKTSADFFINLEKILSNKDNYLDNICRNLKNWFYAVDREAVLNQVKAINDTAPILESIAHLKKLNLGCGRNLIPGWINADLFGQSPQIFQMDASKPFPFPENSFDYVFSEHMFEHLDLIGQQNMLKECYRILKKGGVLRIALPNFNFLVSLINHPGIPINSQYLDWSYSRFVSTKVGFKIDKKHYPIYVVNNFMHDWGHKFIHTCESLIEMGESCGFSNAVRCTIGMSNHPDLCNCEKHQNEIPSWANDLETMVVEFSKS